MTGFESKNRKLKNMLRTSRQDFVFAQEQIKTRVMLAANARHLSHDDATRITFNPKTWPKYVFGTALAGLIVAATGSLSFAANQSRPGDMLFPVQKMQNDFVLSLPLPAAAKAEISTNIVARRIQELDDIEKNPNDTGLVNAEIKAANESIKQAASFVIPSPENPTNPDQTRGQAPKQRQHLDRYRSRLDDLAAKHEQQLQSLTAKIEDDDLKTEIEKNADELENTRQKLQDHVEDGGKTIEGANTENQEPAAKDSKKNTQTRFRSRLHLPFSD